MDLRAYLLAAVLLALLTGCGRSQLQRTYQVAALRPELQVDVRVTQAPDQSDTLHITIERLTRLQTGTALCLNTITQVLSTTSPAQAAHPDDPASYLVDMQTLSGGVAPVCISDSEQVPSVRLPIQQLTFSTESALYPYDRAHFLHSIVIAQAKPARQIPLLVNYHIDIATRSVEQLHASATAPSSEPGFTVVEVVLVRPWLYQILVPIIVGALLLCAILMMLIHERASFIQATIAMTVGTWNGRQLILPVNDLHPIVLDQILLIIYAVIWVSFAVFTFRLQRKHI